MAAVLQNPGPGTKPYPVEKSNGTTIVEHNDDEQYKLPNAKTLQEAGELKIQDENGTEVPFRSLYEGKPGRQLIVFIRHFFCGSCEDYVRYLCQHLPPSLLNTTTPPTTLTLIGCGQHVCIADYRTRTQAALPTDQKFPIYCDPSRALYAKLGMTSNVRQGAQKPEYAVMGLPTLVMSSFKNAVTSGSKGLKGGPAGQNGGEWMFEEGKLKWCRRMANSTDHSSVKELKGVIELVEA